MERGWVGRMRWRRRGAWLWPAFAAATVADAVLGHELPPLGETETLAAAALGALVLNLLGVILLSWPVGLLVRRFRGDLPMLIARDYAGTIVVAGVTVVLLAAGLAHHARVLADERAMTDAISRAQAWIGDRAPARFRSNVQYVSTFAIQPGSIYRACVPSVDGRQTYCVIVDTTRPFPGGVRFGGYEPNSLFSEGVG
ncbi:MAG: hypothetical protein JO168_23690 [Solirubrobacterales bacterium]|nr:hypothetical protein [Solirubrobacterales bacterium]MBV9714643.1 hypothetical protein [Solirubrobacterales bacterium]